MNIQKQQLRRGIIGFLLFLTLGLSGLSIFLGLFYEPPIDDTAVTLTDNCCSGTDCASHGGDWVAGYNDCIEDCQCQRGSQAFCTSPDVCRTGVGNNNCPDNCGNEGQACCPITDQCATICKANNLVCNNSVCVDEGGATGVACETGGTGNGLCAVHICNQCQFYGGADPECRQSNPRIVDCDSATLGNNCGQIDYLKAGNQYCGVKANTCARNECLSGSPPTDPPDDPDPEVVGCGSECGGNRICQDNHQCQNGVCRLNECINNPERCNSDQCSFRSVACGQACPGGVTCQGQEIICSNNQCVRRDCANDPSLCVQGDLCTPITPTCPSGIDTQFRLSGGNFVAGSQISSQNPIPPFALDISCSEEIANPRITVTLPNDTTQNLDGQSEVLAYQITEFGEYSFQCIDLDFADDPACSNTDSFTLTQPEVQEFCGDTICQTNESCESDGAGEYVSCVSIDGIEIGDSISQCIGVASNPTNAGACTFCGDGVVNANEECDFNAPDENNCNQSCRIPDEVDPVCGDTCSNDADCPDDHSCNENGFCELDSCTPETCVAGCTPICGGPCDPDDPFACPVDHVCSEDTNTCVLEACTEEGVSCLDNNCIIESEPLPNTAIFGDRRDYLVYGSFIIIATLFSLQIFRTKKFSYWFYHGGGKVISKRFNVRASREWFEEKFSKPKK